jgi:glycine oxidase
VSRRILIIGGGVIGLSIAETLSRRGVKPVVLEKGDVSREASWAGAGYLSLKGAALCGGPYFDLSVFSLQLYEQWVELLAQESGVDPEFFRGGHLEIGYGEEDEKNLRKLHDRLHSAGIPVGWLSGKEARELEPEISTEVTAAFQMPEGAQVRPPRLNRALLQVLFRRGVDIRDQTPVSNFLLDGTKVRGVKTPQGEIEADSVVLAAGAWSGQLGDRLGLRLPVRPVRGQVVMFSAARKSLKRVLFTPQATLVPRADGRVYVGSTVEDVGFNKNTTLEGVNMLEEAAYRAVPGLRMARMESRWAGLRPGTPDGRPFLGRVPGCEGLILACGHMAHGILLAPATAILVDQIVHGEDTDLELEPFAPGRTFQDPVGS